MLLPAVQAGDEGSSKACPPGSAGQCGAPAADLYLTGKHRQQCSSRSSIWRIRGGLFRVHRFCIKEPLGHSLALILCTGLLCRQCRFRCCRRHWSHHCCQPPQECCLCDAHRMHYAGSLFGPLLLPASCRCGDCSLPAARWSLLLYYSSTDQ